LWPFLWLSLLAAGLSCSGMLIFVLQMWVQGDTPYYVLHRSPHTSRALIVLTLQHCQDWAGIVALIVSLLDVAVWVVGSCFKGKWGTSPGSAFWAPVIFDLTPLVYLIMRPSVGYA